MPRVQKRSQKSSKVDKKQVQKTKVLEPIEPDIEENDDFDDEVSDVEVVETESEKISQYPTEFDDDKPRTKLYNFVFAVIGCVITATAFVVLYFVFKPNSMSAATAEPQILTGELHFDQESYNNAKALIDYYKEVNMERGAFISDENGDVYLVVGDHSYRILSNDETAKLLAVSDDGDIEDVSDLVDDNGEVVSTVSDDGKSIIYHIKWGDTLCQISSKYDQPITDIAKLNGIKNVHLIYAGNDMKIPTEKTKMTPEEIQADNAKYHQQWLDMQKNKKK